jgi:hypothetical protein
VAGGTASVCMHLHSPAECPPFSVCGACLLARACAAWWTDARRTGLGPFLPAPSFPGGCRARVEEGQDTQAARRVGQRVALHWGDGEVVATATRLHDSERCATCLLVVWATCLVVHFSLYTHAGCSCDFTICHRWWQERCVGDGRARHGVPRYPKACSTAVADPDAGASGNRCLPRCGGSGNVESGESVGTRCVGGDAALLRVGTCTAARCGGVVGVVRGYRFAQPTAIDRHRVAMRGWFGQLYVIGALKRSCRLSAGESVRGLVD